MFKLMNKKIIIIKFSQRVQFDGLFFVYFSTCSKNGACFCVLKTGG